MGQVLLQPLCMHSKALESPSSHACIWHHIPQRQQPMAVTSRVPSPCTCRYNTWHAPLPCLGLFDKSYSGLYEQSWLVRPALSLDILSLQYQSLHHLHMHTAYSRSSKIAEKLDTCCMCSHAVCVRMLQFTPQGSRAFELDAPSALLYMAVASGNANNTSHSVCKVSCDIRPCISR